MISRARAASPGKPASPTAARGWRCAVRTTGSSSRSSAPSDSAATSSTSPSTSCSSQVLGVHYLLAAIGSFLVAVTNNYFWNRHWTFHGDKGHVGIQGARFLVVSLLALVANLVVLQTLVHLGVEKIPAQAIAIVLVTPVNFVGNKLWTFRMR